MTETTKVSDPAAEKVKSRRTNFAQICRWTPRSDSMSVTVEQLATSIRNDDFSSIYSQGLNFSGFDEQMIKS
jgi:hypothetical protein